MNLNWLAYSDHLVRSNDRFLSEGITSWTTVAIPLEFTITAISTLFSDKLLIYDGLSGKLHALNLEGDILMSWDALGQDLTKGDAVLFVRPNGNPLILQTDGRGFLSIFDPLALEG
jgi:hypothetical protein